MKSTLLKATVLASAALALGALASPAAAKTLKYTFGISGGGAYCDGLTITTTDGITYGGTHTGSCVNPDPAGGFAVKLPGGKFIDIATTYSATTTDAWTFYLSTSSNTWYLYHTVGGVYTLNNSGPLIKGTPPAAKGATSAMNPKVGAKIDKIPLY